METHRLKKYISLFCMYKMIEITKETCEKNGVQVLVFKGKYSNLPAVTNKYSLKLKKREDLQICNNCQSCRRFLKDIFAIQIIMDC